nr:reverse transcriptase domain-containing protein [Tanacetum cinerariifolium]
MSTRSSARNLFPALDNLELTIRRRPRVDPTLLNDFEMATNENGDDVPPLEGATVGKTQNVYAVGAYNQGGASHGQNPPPAYQAPAYQAPGYQAPVHQAPIPQPQVMTTTEFINYMKANHAILKNMQTNMTSLTNSNLELKNMYGQFMKMNTASSSSLRTLPSNTITNPKEDLKGITTRSGNVYQRPTIPTTSSPKVVERETEVTKDMVPPTNNGSTKDVQPSVVQIENSIPNFDPVAALVVEPVEVPLGDPGKFLIPCDFLRMDECLALSDLGASINLMQLSVWNKLSLPELSPTCMTLELEDRSISRPVRVAEDVFVKVRTFYFPADFIVVDFDADPRVPLILERSFLKTERALINVYEGELTLRVGNKAITFNLDQTSRYSANYDDMSVNRIDLIDVACEEYSQEVLGFSMSGNPTPSTEPIVSNSSPTLTPFRDSDFLLEETDAFLVIDDGPISPEIDNSHYDLEGDILLLKEFLNDDPSSSPLPPQELKIVEPKKKNLLLKNHPWSNLRTYHLISNMHFWRGIDPEFCTHKILMEDDFKQAVQHQRRVNPKIHEVIKKEVFKLLDAGLIYPISDSPWVSPVHCVPKKSGFTVIENQENELISTRLVTGWRVCIDYQKLNDTTRKDHFSLPFMDQMLERLVGNEYYCFLDGFSGYFQILIDPKIKKRLHSRVLMERLPTVACFLAYAMHRARSKGENRASWSDKLDDALWPSVQLSKHPSGVPLQLNELNELRDQAYENSLIYKEKTKRIHDSKIKDRVFNVGDRVLLFNSRLKIFSGKLKTRWSGPFTITQVFPYGSVELSQTDTPNFKLNGHRLKHYFGEDIPQMVVPDLQTFPKDQ